MIIQFTFYLIKRFRWNFLQEIGEENESSIWLWYGDNGSLW